MRPTSGAAECRVPPPCPKPGWRPLPAPLHEVATTPARHAQPRAWLRAVTWLVGAGLHPRAGERTLAVARDLARRMDYTRGLVLYDLDGTAARLDVHPATVKRHIAILRQLGALAWRRHGTRANLHLPGRRYTGTATIYAATIPPIYDTAMGHRLDGTGYTARIVGFTGAGRRRAIEEAAVQGAARASRRRPPGRSAARRRPAGHPGAHDRSRSGRAPHSLDHDPDVRKADVSGGLKDTPRQRAARPKSTTAPPHTTRRGPRRHPSQVEHDITIARRVRPLVPWTQHEHLRRLAYALRPLVDRGLDETAIASELTGMAMAWRPARPAAYITASLRRAAEHETALRREQATRDAAARPADNVEWVRAVQQLHVHLDATTPERTDTDRRRARLYAWDRWQEVAEHYDQDPDDALDLYGRRLCVYAVERAAPH